MSNTVGTGVSRVIVDTDGEAATVTGGRLDVNAELVVGDVNIGDVDINSFPAPLDISHTGGGTEAGVLRVTLATNSTGVLSIDDNGGSLTIDGTVTANLSATDNSAIDALAGSMYVEDTAHSDADRGTFVLGIHNEGEALLTADGDYSGIGVDRFGAVAISERYGAGETMTLPIKQEDSASGSGHYGVHILSVAKAAPVTTAGTEGDYASFVTNTRGALYVERPNTFTPETVAMIDVDNTEEQLSATTGVLSCNEIFLQADEDNSGYVIVGDADVADNRGMKLNPGDTLILDVLDTRGIYLWGSAANQNVRCMMTIRPS